jgi:hypothetical protein
LNLATVTELEVNIGSSGVGQIQGNQKVFTEFDYNVVNLNRRRTYGIKKNNETLEKIIVFSGML